MIPKQTTLFDFMLTRLNQLLADITETANWDFRRIKAAMESSKIKDQLR